MLHCESTWKPAGLQSACEYPQMGIATVEVIVMPFLLCSNYPSTSKHPRERRLQTQDMARMAHLIVMGFPIIRPSFPLIKPISSNDTSVGLFTETWGASIMGVVGDPIL